MGFLTYCTWRNTVAFLVWLSWRGYVDCSLFGCERVHLGAYEAPILAYAYFCYRTKLLLPWYKCFWCVKLRGILLGLALIPILFYTYNGVIGKSPDWFNIAIFFIAAAVAFIYETRLFTSEKIRFITPNLSLISLLCIAMLFLIFTFATPEIGIYKDPISGTYGIWKTKASLFCGALLI